MPTAAPHGEIDANQAERGNAGNDVYIAIAARRDELLRQNALQSFDLITVTRCCFKLLRIGRRLHLLLKRFDDFAFFTLQEQLGILYIAAIVVFADSAYTRGGAAFDLMQKAWTGAVLEHRIVTGAELKDLL